MDTGSGLFEIETDPVKQQKFVDDLLAASEKRKVKFAIYFDKVAMTRFGSGDRCVGPKKTEIYAQVSTKSLRGIVSPIERLNINFETDIRHIELKRGRKCTKNDLKIKKCFMRNPSKKIRI